MKSLVLNTNIINENIPKIEYFCFDVNSNNNIYCSFKSNVEQNISIIDVKSGSPCFYETDKTTSLGDEVTLVANVEKKMYLSEGKYKVQIQNKYALTGLNVRLDAKNQLAISADLDMFRYNDVIEFIFFNAINTGQYTDISDLFGNYSGKFRYLNVNNSYGISGSVEKMLEKYYNIRQGDIELYLRNTAITFNSIVYNTIIATFTENSISVYSGETLIGSFNGTLWTY